MLCTADDGFWFLFAGLPASSFYDSRFLVHSLRISLTKGCVVEICKAETSCNAPSTVSYIFGKWVHSESSFALRDALEFV